VILLAHRTAGDALADGLSNAFTVTGFAAAKLAILSINPANPSVAPATFSVTVQAQDLNSLPANVSSITSITITKKTGAGNLGGTTIGSLNIGQNTVTIVGLTYTIADTNVVITASTTSGESLSSVDSSTFNVLGSSISIRNFADTQVIAAAQSGDQVRVAGNAFSAGQAVEVHLNGTSAATGCDPSGVLLGSTAAGGGGTFNFVVTIPLQCKGSLTVFAYLTPPAVSASSPAAASTTLTVNPTVVRFSTPYQIINNVRTDVVALFIGQSAQADLLVDIVPNGNLGAWTLTIAGSGLTVTGCDVGANAFSICNNGILTGVSTAGLVGTQQLATVTFTVSGALGTTGSVTPNVTTLTTTGQAVLANNTTAATLQIGSKCDVNSDGAINSVDALVILLSTVGLAVLPAGTGDSNTDTTVGDATDALYVLQFVAGQKNSCPQ
jgi:hypothetical protein